MQLSIRDASRFVVGAAVLRERALKANPSAGITFDNVAITAMRNDADGKGLRDTISRLADGESEWFRTTPPHTLASERVMQTRGSEVRTLNSINAALLATIELGKRGIAGDATATDSLRDQLQATVRSIDEMPGSTTERRVLLRSLGEECAEAAGDRAFVEEQLSAAQQDYLALMMQERLSAYAAPAKERSDDLDLGP